MAHLILFFMVGIKKKQKNVVFVWTLEEPMDSKQLAAENVENHKPTSN